MRIQRSPFVSGYFAGTLIRTTCLLVGAITAWVVVTSLGGRPGMADPRAAARSLNGAQASIAGGAKALPARSAPHGTTSSAATAGLAKAYGKLPMTFEPNRGQTDSSVKFLSRGLGYQLFLTQSQTVLSLKQRSAVSGQPSVTKLETGNSKIGGRTPNSEPLSSAVLRMTLAGANANAPMAGVDELPGKSNYLIGRDSSQWHTQIPNYRKIAVKQVYPGIDLVYYGQGRQLEYDFVVAPGADPNAIALAIETGNSKLETGNSKTETRETSANPDNVRIDSNGDVVVKFDGGEVRFHRPAIYQLSSNSGDQTQVEGRYVLRASKLETGNSKPGNPKSEIQNPKWEVGFEIASYDATRPLIIDPVLSYSTYLGGNAPGTPGTGLDAANAIAVSSDGSAFVAGETDSLDFPTVHALQPEAGGPFDFPDDAFVSKISPDGSTLLYSTYLGGKSIDRASGIAVDTFGNAYVTGTTISEDFPASIGAADPNCGNDGHCDATLGKGLLKSDAFATKLNPEGSAIVYSTFISNLGPELVDHLGNPVLDGNGNPQFLGANDRGFGIAVDLNGVAYVVGTTDGADQAGPFFGGGNDCFLAKISATGSTFQFFTDGEDTADFGGTLEDQAYGVAVDNAGHAFVTGVTYSNNYPVTGGTAFQSALAGDADAFFMEIDTTQPVATSIMYSTYLGGVGRDYGTAIAKDASGNAYITGVMNSVGFPVTAGVVQNACALDLAAKCEGDVFVSKFNPALSGAASLIYSTYVGGTGADYGAAIALDSLTNAYVTGYTNSTDFPTSGSPFQGNYGGGNTDAFVFKLDPTGTSLVYSSYLGGSNAEDGRGIAVDVNGDAYVTGQTCSTDFPTARPLQPAQAGNCDAFVTKVHVGPDIGIGPTSLAFGTQAVGTTSAPQTITVTSIGDSALDIGQITISVGDFLIQNDSCSKALLANKGDNCSIQITFTPSATGTRVATLTIPDNAPGSPQSVPISGGAATTAGQFSLSASPAAATVFAGSSASYALVVTPSSGFNTAVSLSCSIPFALSRASCSVQPASVTPDGIHPVTATVTVSTAARTMVPPGPNVNSPDLRNPISPPWLVLMFAMAIMALLTAKRRRAWVSFTIVMLFVLLWAGCGGGVNPVNSVAGTPTGSYTITLTGTSGATTQSTSVSLTVN